MGTELTAVELSEQLKEVYKKLPQLQAADMARFVMFNLELIAVVTAVFTDGKQGSMDKLCEYAQHIYKEKVKEHSETFKAKDDKLWEEFSKL